VFLFFESLSVSFVLSDTFGLTSAAGAGLTAGLVLSLSNLSTISLLSLAK